jgi:hypothetical protein
MIQTANGRNREVSPMNSDTNHCYNKMAAIFTQTAPQSQRMDRFSRFKRQMEEIERCHRWTMIPTVVTTKWPPYSLNLVYKANGAALNHQLSTALKGRGA